ncbi:hypothetical protein [Dysgonomonas sp. 520]|uniref:hypothetical protein n=1 Tax=Dysgonomonas sp. 520 TaxID=2302931 RepID=UPI0013D0229E|nr:hypothetical protein [Dysgonomonas sp. 520]NDW09729.1 hypothetical protein [Dysgonomonas sp. 520]
MEVLNHKLKSLFLAAMLFSGSVYAQVTIGSDITPPKAAILNLQSQTDNLPAEGGVNANGGVVLPRVKLSEINSLKPFITSGGTAAEKAAHKGMNVYNIGGNGIAAGQYVWDGVRWLQLLTGIPPTPITTFGHLYAKETIINSTWGGAYKDGLIKWSSKMDASDSADIAINEDGSYVFNVRLFAKFCDPETGGIYGFKNEMKYWGYISLYVNDVMKDVSIVYCLNSPASNSPGWDSGSSLSIPLAAECKTGDKVELYWNNHLITKDVENPTKLFGVGFVSNPGQNISDIANMVYWKL